MKSKSLPWIPYFLLGTILGVCALAFSVFSAFFAGVENPPYLAYFITPVFSPRSPSFPLTPSPSPNTSTAFPSTPTAKAILSKAEQFLLNGQPDAVAELLQPVMDTWNPDDDLAAANKYLGQAQVAMGHPKLAAPYFEKLFVLQPTAENLLLLAVAYDTGGENKKALDQYLKLDKLGDTQAQVDHEFVHTRINYLCWVLGIRTPKP